jgi:hypothetical protein
VQTKSPRERDRVQAPRGLIVRRCVLESPSHGLLLEGGCAGFVRIEHNRFERCEKYGVFATGIVENLELLANRISVDPDAGLEHGLRLYDLDGRTTIAGNEVENRRVHRNSDGLSFIKTTLWLLEAPGEGVLIEDNRFLGGLVQIGGGGHVGGEEPVREVTLRRNRFVHERQGTAIQISGGVFGARIVENVITTPNDDWLFVSGYRDRERHRTPCRDVRWGANHVNGSWVAGWTGVDARPREHLGTCGPEP